MAIMTDNPNSDTHGREDRIKAAELYREGRQLEAKRDYRGAIQSYQKSLALRDDKKVRTAYFRLLAAIGPM